MSGIHLGASAWGVHKFGIWGVPGLRAGLGVRYISENPDGIGVVSVPSVTLFDAMVAYDVDRWRLQLRRAPGGVNAAIPRRDAEVVAAACYNPRLVRALAFTPPLSRCTFPAAPFATSSCPLC